VRLLSADWVVPVEGLPLQDASVAIGDDGVIQAVGPASELGHGERFRDSVILPGFVNAHSHLEYAAYAGFGDGLPFAPWIAIHVQRKARLTVDAMDDLARAGAATCLRSGITTVGDCSFSGSAAVGCAELGLRAIIYLEVFGRDESALDRFLASRARVADSFSDRVRLGVSPHAPYTCSIELYRACADLDLPLATHLSESEAELAYLAEGGGPWSSFAEMLVEPYGRRAIEALAEAGVLGRDTVAAHCVYVNGDDLSLLAANDVAVAHCPRSNALLGCGIAPLAELRAAGLRVAIATDSPASTPSFDMFDELRTAIYAARARERRAEALAASAALELATLGGARALRLDGEIGSLVPGKQADLTVLSLADSPFLPVEDPVTAVVLGGSPERVTATLVSGEDRYRKGSTEWHELTGAARNARSRMLQ
jgi:cytosine/adenosine deaminase-related metal-dependent hydrolase